MEGSAAVKRTKSELFGFINTEGQVMISENYETALPFCNRLAYIVDEKNKNGYIDESCT